MQDHFEECALLPFHSQDGWELLKEFDNEETYDFLKTEIQKYYNTELKSKIRFVFTNNLLKEEHLHERYNNIALNIFNNPNFP